MKKQNSICKLHQNIPMREHKTYDHEMSVSILREDTLITDSDTGGTKHEKFVQSNELMINSNKVLENLKHKQSKLQDLNALLIKEKLITQKFC
jgi:predicted transcriptional regulator